MEETKIPNNLAKEVVHEILDTDIEAKEKLNRTIKADVETRKLKKELRELEGEVWGRWLLAALAVVGFIVAYRANPVIAYSLTLFMIAIPSKVKPVFGWVAVLWICQIDIVARITEFLAVNGVKF